MIDRARKGETQPLQPLKYTADTDQHPVCTAILKHLGAGMKGNEVRDHLQAPSYGWPQDAIDGTFYALVASGHVLPLNNLSKQVDAKGLERRQITQCTFKPEIVTISPDQKIQIRKIFQKAGVGCQPGQENEKAPELPRAHRQRPARGVVHPARHSDPEH